MTSDSDIQTAHMTRKTMVETVTEYVNKCEEMYVSASPQIGPHTAVVVFSLVLPFDFDKGAAEMDAWAQHVANCPECQADEAE